MTRSNVRALRQGRARIRPRLETLEDRTAPAVFTVTNTADSGKGSLRSAVLIANANPGPDTINFDTKVFAEAQTVELTGGSITITDPVAIQGPAAGLTLDADYLSGHFILSMTHALDPVSMSGLTLTRGGDVYDTSLDNQNASLTLSRMVITNSTNGGISVGVAGFDPWGPPVIYSATLSLTDSTVSDNSGCGVTIADGSDADIRHSIISGNSGEYGGGIRVGPVFFVNGYPIGSASLTLTECTVIDNTAYSGGGIWVGGGATVIRSTITGNLATSSGGGISVSDGGATVIGSTITGNLAGFEGGGGIDVWNGTLAIAASTISGNAADVGGGINIFGYSGFYENVPASLTMEESTVSRNKSTSAGGGVSMSNVVAVIRNCTISGNFASAGAAAVGGGLAESSSSLSLKNSTVAFNSAGMGSGGGIDSRQSQLDLRNVILSNNSAGSGGPDVNGEANVDFSLISNTAGALILSGGNNLLNIDARLGILADNGGPTRTHRPGPGSPVRNAGGETPGIDNDQRGPGFARVLQGRPDMGAMESTDPTPTAFATVPTVTAAGGTVYVILVTYSDDSAIQASSLGTGDLLVYGRGNMFSVTPTFVWADVNSNGTPRLATYVFTPPGGTWGPEDNGVYTVYVNENQVFDADATPWSVPFGAIGAFAVQTPTTYIVDEISDADDGNRSPGHLSLREAVGLANADRSPDTIIFSPAVFNASRTIALKGVDLKITNPLTIIGPANELTLDAQGRNRHFQIDMSWPGDAVSISGLILTNGSADTGGAVWNVDGTLGLSRMVITKNAALEGGGIDVSGGSLTLADSTINGNDASYYGGGVAAGYRTGVTITGSTISGNTTSEDLGSGGGVFVGVEASLTMADSTVSGNTAQLGYGGGIVLWSTNAAIISSTIAFNDAKYGGGIYGGGTIQSTIVAKNVSGTGPDIFGPVTATFSLIGNTAGVTLEPGSANNLLDRDPLLTPLADNGGPTWSHALLLGSPAIDTGSNPANLAYDQRDASFPRVFGLAADIGAFEVQQSTVPSVVVNAGQANLVQRSMVTSLTVTFGGVVTFAGPAGGAFRLQRTGPGGTLGDVTLAVDLSGSTATQTIARLTFSGELTEGANSLVDGNYTLTVLSRRVSGGILGGDNVSSLFQLYGDLNGDKAVNGLDLVAFRTAFGASNGDANYRPELDFDGDGDVNGPDLAVFRTRFGVIIP
jgi:hypothetical protein